MKKLLYLVLFLPFTVLAQDPIPPTGMSGSELRDWLRDNWYLPWHNDLGYGPAREAMFGTVDNEGGIIECVYTGFTQPAEVVTFPDPMNTEHTVPQSFFDSQLPMRSDIHHLFPTHQQANSDRGSLPFDEVVDAQADEWIIGTSGNYSSSGSIPNNDIDDYSEVHHNVAFEPREENKGNTSRAIFYFYTMYPSVGELSAVGDPNILYMWHQNDPPDAEEIDRDEQIQSIQGNYNPYIRQPGLVANAWDFISGLDEEELVFELIVNSEIGEIRINTLVQNTTISVHNMLGQEVTSVTNSKRIPISGWSSSVYILSVFSSNGMSSSQKFIIP